MIRYEVEVYQPEDFRLIEVRLYQVPSHIEKNVWPQGRTGLYIGARIALWDRLEYGIMPNFRLPSGSISADEARAFIEWLQMAVEALELLQSAITTPADFDKEWRARMVARTVVLDEVKETVTV